MKLAVLINVLFFLPLIAFAQPIDVDECSKKALQKVEDLGQYISVISDKNKSSHDSDLAMELALRLFLDKNNSKVEVSSINHTTKNEYSISKYLRRLKMLKYDKIEIRWTQIEYVSELRKGPDNKYYGIITIEQTFRGFVDGKVKYSDKTNKNISVVLDSYELIEDGESVTRWDVLLNDIGVKETKRL